jgi:hypothetical protein
MLLIPLAISACVSRAEFEQHLVEYNEVRLDRDSLLVQLTRWGLAMEQWGITTGNVICDIFAKNPPSTPYAPDTQNYCGPGDPGPNDPPEPPEWGG